jgi:hypothetical protein
MANPQTDQLAIMPKISAKKTKLKSKLSEIRSKMIKKGSKGGRAAIKRH